MPKLMLKGDEELRRLVKECIDMGDIPIVVTRFADAPLQYQGKPAVIFRCGFEGKGVVVTVSEDTWDALDRAMLDIYEIAKVLGIPIERRK